MSKNRLLKLQIHHVAHHRHYKLPTSNSSWGVRREEEKHFLTDNVVLLVSELAQSWTYPDGVTGVCGGRQGRLEPRLGKNALNLFGLLGTISLPPPPPPSSAAFDCVEGLSGTEDCSVVLSLVGIRF